MVKKENDPNGSNSLLKTATNKRSGGRLAMSAMRPRQIGPPIKNISISNEASKTSEMTDSVEEQALRPAKIRETSNGEIPLQSQFAGQQTELTSFANALSTTPQPQAFMIPRVPRKSFATGKKNMEIQKGISLLAPSPMTLDRVQVQMGQERNAPESRQYRIEQELRNHHQWGEVKPTNFEKQPPSSSLKPPTVPVAVATPVAAATAPSASRAQTTVEGFEAEYYDYTLPVKPSQTESTQHKKKSLMKRVLGKIKPKNSKKKDDPQLLAVLAKQKAGQKLTLEEARMIARHAIENSKQKRNQEGKNDSSFPKSLIAPVLEIDTTKREGSTVSDLDASLRLFPIGEVVMEDDRDGEKRDDDSVSTLGTPRALEALDIPDVKSRRIVKVSKSKPGGVSVQQKDERSGSDRSEANRVPLAVLPKASIAAASQRQNVIEQHNSQHSQQQSSESINALALDPTARSGGANQESIKFHVQSITTLNSESEYDVIARDPTELGRSQESVKIRHDPSALGPKSTPLTFQDSNAETRDRGTHMDAKLFYTDNKNAFRSALVDRLTSASRSNDGCGSSDISAAIEIVLTKSGVSADQINIARKGRILQTAIHKHLSTNPFDSDESSLLPFPADIGKKPSGDMETSSLSASDVFMKAIDAAIHDVQTQLMEPKVSDRDPNLGTKKMSNSSRTDAKVSSAESPAMEQNSNATPNSDGKEAQDRQNSHQVNHLAKDSPSLEEPTAREMAAAAPTTTTATTTPIKQSMKLGIMSTLGLVGSVFGRKREAAQSESTSQQQQQRQVTQTPLARTALPAQQKDENQQVTKTTVANATQLTQPQESQQVTKTIVDSNAPPTHTRDISDAVKPKDVLPVSVPKTENSPAIVEPQSSTEARSEEGNIQATLNYGDANQIAAKIQKGLFLQPNLPTPSSSDDESTYLKDSETNFNVHTRVRSPTASTPGVELIPDSDHTKDKLSIGDKPVGHEEPEARPRTSSRNSNSSSTTTLYEYSKHQQMELQIEDSSSGSEQQQSHTETVSSGSVYIEASSPDDNQRSFPQTHAKVPHKAAIVGGLAALSYARDKNDSKLATRNLAVVHSSSSSDIYTTSSSTAANDTAKNHSTSLPDSIDSNELQTASHSSTKHSSQIKYEPKNRTTKLQSHSVKIESASKSNSSDNNLGVNFGDIMALAETQFVKKVSSSSSGGVSKNGFKEAEQIHVVAGGMMGLSETQLDKQVSSSSSHSISKNSTEIMAQNRLTVGRYSVDSVPSPDNILAVQGQAFAKKIVTRGNTTKENESGASSYDQSDGERSAKRLPGAGVTFEVDSSLRGRSPASTESRSYGSEEPNASTVNVTAALLHPPPLFPHKQFSAEKSFSRAFEEIIVLDDDTLEDESDRVIMISDSLEARHASPASRRGQSHGFGDESSVHEVVDCTKNVGVYDDPDGDVVVCYEINPFGIVEASQVISTKEASAAVGPKTPTIDESEDQEPTQEESVQASVCSGEASSAVSLEISAADDSEDKEPAEEESKQRTVSKEDQAEVAARSVGSETLPAVVSGEQSTALPKENSFGLIERPTTSSIERPHQDRYQYAATDSELEDSQAESGNENVNKEVEAEDLKRNAATVSASASGLTELNPAAKKMKSLPAGHPTSTVLDNKVGVRSATDNDSKQSVHESKRIMSKVVDIPVTPVTPAADSAVEVQGKHDDSLQEKNDAYGSSSSIYSNAHTKNDGEETQSERSVQKLPAYMAKDTILDGDEDGIEISLFEELDNLLKPRKSEDEREAMDHQTLTTDNQVDDKSVSDNTTKLAAVKGKTSVSPGTSVCDQSLSSKSAWSRLAKPTPGDMRSNASCSGDSRSRTRSKVEKVQDREIVFLNSRSKSRPQISESKRREVQASKQKAGHASSDLDMIAPLQSMQSTELPIGFTDFFADGLFDLMSMDESSALPFSNVVHSEHAAIELMLSGERSVPVAQVARAKASFDFDAPMQESLYHPQNEKDDLISGQSQKESDDSNRRQSSNADNMNTTDLASIDSSIQRRKTKHEALEYVFEEMVSGVRKLAGAHPAVVHPDATGSSVAKDRSIQQNIRTSEVESTTSKKNRSLMEAKSKCLENNIILDQSDSDEIEKRETVVLDPLPSSNLRDGQGVASHDPARGAAAKVAAVAAVAATIQAMTSTSTKSRTSSRKKSHSSRSYASVAARSHTKMEDTFIPAPVLSDREVLPEHMLEEDDVYWDTLSTIASTKDKSIISALRRELAHAMAAPIPSEITTMDPTMSSGDSSSGKNIQKQNSNTSSQRRSTKNPVQLKIAKSNSSIGTGPVPAMQQNQNSLSKSANGTNSNSERSSANSKPSSHSSNDSSSRLKIRLTKSSPPELSLIRQNFARSRSPALSVQQSVQQSLIQRKFSRSQSPVLSVQKSVQELVQQSPQQLVQHADQQSVQQSLIQQQYSRSLSPVLSVQHDNPQSQTRTEQLSASPSSSPSVHENIHVPDSTPQQGSKSFDAQIYEKPVETEDERSVMISMPLPSSTLLLSPSPKPSMRHIEASGRTQTQEGSRIVEEKVQTIPVPTVFAAKQVVEQYPTHSKDVHEAMTKLDSLIDDDKSASSLSYSLSKYGGFSHQSSDADGKHAEINTTTEPSSNHMRNYINETQFSRYGSLSGEESIEGPPSHTSSLSEHAPSLQLQRSDSSSSHPNQARNLVAILDAARPKDNSTGSYPSNTGPQHNSTSPEADANFNADALQPSTSESSEHGGSSLLLAITRSDLDADDSTSQHIHDHTEADDMVYEAHIDPDAENEVEVEEQPIPENCEGEQYEYHMYKRQEQEQYQQQQQGQRRQQQQQQQQHHVADIPDYSHIRMASENAIFGGTIEEHFQQFQQYVQYRQLQQQQHLHQLRQQSVIGNQESSHTNRYFDESVESQGVEVERFGDKRGERSLGTTTNTDASIPDKNGSKNVYWGYEEHFDAASEAESNKLPPRNQTERETADASPSEMSVIDLASQLRHNATRSSPMTLNQSAQQRNDPPGESAGARRLRKTNARRVRILVDPPLQPVPTKAKTIKSDAVKKAPSSSAKTKPRENSIRYLLGQMDKLESRPSSKVEAENQSGRTSKLTEKDSGSSEMMDELDQEIADLSSEAEQELIARTLELSKQLLASMGTQTFESTEHDIVQSLLSLDAEDATLSLDAQQMSASVASQAPSSHVPRNITAKTVEETEDATPSLDVIPQKISPSVASQAPSNHAEAVEAEKNPGIEAEAEAEMNLEIDVEAEVDAERNVETQAETASNVGAGSVDDFESYVESAQSGQSSFLDNPTTPVSDAEVPFSVTFQSSSQGLKAASASKNKTNTNTDRSNDEGSQSRQQRQPNATENRDLSSTPVSDISPETPIELDRLLAQFHMITQRLVEATDDAQIDSQIDSQADDEESSNGDIEETSKSQQIEDNLQVPGQPDQSQQQQQRRQQHLKKLQKEQDQTNGGQERQQQQYVEEQQQQRHAQERHQQQYLEDQKRQFQQQQEHQHQVQQRQQQYLEEHQRELEEREHRQQLREQEHQHALEHQQQHQQQYLEEQEQLRKQEEQQKEQEWQLQEREQEQERHYQQEYRRQQDQLQLLQQQQQRDDQGDELALPQRGVVAGSGQQETPSVRPNLSEDDSRPASNTNSMGRLDQLRRQRQLAIDRLQASKNIIVIDDEENAESTVDETLVPPKDCFAPQQSMSSSTTNDTTNALGGFARQHPLAEGTSTPLQSHMDLASCSISNSADSEENEERAFALRNSQSEIGNIRNTPVPAPIYQSYSQPLASVPVRSLAGPTSLQPSTSSGASVAGETHASDADDHVYYGIRQSQSEIVRDSRANSPLTLHQSHSQPLSYRSSHRSGIRIGRAIESGSISISGRRPSPISSTSAETNDAIASKAANSIYSHTPNLRQLRQARSETSQEVSRSESPFPIIQARSYPITSTHFNQRELSSSNRERDHVSNYQFVNMRTFSAEMQGSSANNPVDLEQLAMSMSMSSESDKTTPSSKARDLQQQIAVALRTSKAIRHSQEELGDELKTFKSRYHDKTNRIEGQAFQMIGDVQSFRTNSHSSGSFQTD